MPVTLRASTAGQTKQMYTTRLTADLKPAQATQAVIYSLLFGIHDGMHNRVAAV